MTVYRGNLTMPTNATPDQHIKTRKEFLRILSRWKVKTGYVLEMHGIIDITDWLNAHWDITAYSNAAKKLLKKVVSKAWSDAGGLRQSLVSITDSELKPTAKYQAKDTIDPSRARRYLPASQRTMGMNTHWSTNKFWSRSKEALWSEWKQEWFGSSKNEEFGSSPILDINFRTKIISKFKAYTPDYEDYLQGFDWFVSESAKGSNCSGEDIEKLLESVNECDAITPRIKDVTA